MRRPDLVPDCGSCAAVCCVATYFEASDDFAFTKPAGVACRHLTRDCRCAIHDELAARGFGGCAVYDCYGAGQRVTRAFAGAAGAERQRDAAFRILEAVHELLFLLTEAEKLCPPSRADLRAELARAVEALDELAARPARALLRGVGAALGEPSAGESGYARGLRKRARRE